MVQRYDPEVEGEPGCEVAIMLPMSQPDDVYATPDYPGEYVKHADYAALAHARKQTAELVEAVEKIVAMENEVYGALNWQTDEANALAAQLKEQDDEASL